MSVAMNPTLIPHSTATAAPLWPAPAWACDAHLHILDAALDPRSTPAQDATVGQYRQVQAHLGTQRAVVVQPRLYGTDNHVTLDAIARMGVAHTRGIAVVHPDISDAELLALHAGGIRGVRLSLYTPHQAAVSFEMTEPLAHRVQHLGWHLQLHWTADQIAEHAHLLMRLPTPVVFDHLARLPVPEAQRHPAFVVVSELLQRGRAWVKLSGAYLCSTQAPGSGYTDLTDMARAWVALAPKRLVWGSDWPHVTETHAKPDDSELFDLLHTWTGSDTLRHRVLVDNPAELYGFNPV